MNDLFSVSCATTTYCVAVGPAGAYLFNGQQWSQLPAIAGLNGFLTSVSCASDSFCVAMGNFDGSPETSTAYVLDGTTWSQSVPLSASSEYPAVSCQSESWCMAVGAGAELWNGISWTSVAPALPEFDLLTVVSCPDASTCTAMDSDGSAWTFDNGAWTSEPVFTNLSSTSISCVSATSCVASDVHSDIATLGGSTWTDGPSPLEPVSGTEGGPSLAISCSDATFCAAVDDGGNVWYDNFGTWTTSARQVIDNASLDLSCVSQSFCMAVDTNGDYLTYDGSTWSEPAVTMPDEIFMDSVSCVSSDFCVATDYSGHTLVYDGTDWSASGWIGNGYSSKVSCASQTFCVQVGGTDETTFDGTNWSTPVPISTSELTTVSCSSADFCAAFDQNGDAYTFNGASWTEESAIVNPGVDTVVEAVSCPSDGFCVAVDSSGDGISYQSGVWTLDPVVNTVHGFAMGLFNVSCASSTFCVGVGSIGSTVVFNGVNWTPGQTIGSLNVNAVSCPSTTFCEAAETNGAIHTMYVDTTSVTAATSVPTATVGQPVTYTAAVATSESAIASVPDRNVTFSVGSDVLCTTTLVASTAQCQSTNAPVGTDQVTATYSGDIHFSSSQTAVSLAIVPADAPPAVTSPDAAAFLAGSVGSFTVTTTGYPIPTIVEVGALPSGVTFIDGPDGTATLSGDPTESGTFPIQIQASNGLSPGADQSFELTVSPPSPPTFTSADSATFVVGVPGGFTVSAIGPPAPTFSVSPALPSGLTLDRTTGLISGTPVAPGIHRLTLNATNGAHPNATQVFTLTVVAMQVATTALPAATPGSPYAQSLVVLGGTGPYKWTTPTVLPKGLKLSLTGQLSGTTSRKAVPGTYPIVVKVTDSTPKHHLVATATLSLTVL